MRGAKHRAPEVLPCNGEAEEKEPEKWSEAWVENTLESPLTARRSNQLCLKKINPEYSLEGLIPKLQYFLNIKKEKKESFLIS